MDTERFSAQVISQNHYFKNQTSEYWFGKWCVPRMFLDSFVCLKKVWCFVSAFLYHIVEKSGLARRWRTFWRQKIKQKSLHLRTSTIYIEICNRNLYTLTMLVVKVLITKVVWSLSVMYMVCIYKRKVLSKRCNKIVLLA